MLKRSVPRIGDQQHGSRRQSFPDPFQGTGLRGRRLPYCLDSCHKAARQLLRHDVAGRYQDLVAGCVELADFGNASAELVVADDFRGFDPCLGCSDLLLPHH
ncbi:hypothetical protein D3C71_1750950 [compost metagenome]